MSANEAATFAGAPSVRYRMRHKSFSIGADYWITDDRGDRVYKIDAKVPRLRKTLVLEDARGHQLLTVHESVLSWRDQMQIEAPDGTTVATVRKATIAPVRASWTVELSDGDLYVTGDVRAHEYRIEHGHETLAAVSRTWLDVADEYGVEVFSGADPALMLAIAAVLDAAPHESP